MRLAAALAAALLAAQPAHADDFPGFARAAAPGSHVAMEVGPPHPVRISGMITTRIELRTGECGAPCPPDTERAEMAETGGGQSLDRPAVTAISLYIPRNVAAMPGVAVTLARFDQAGERRLALEWRDEGLVATGPALSAEALLVPANLLPGRWQDVVVEQRWSAGAGGVLRLWINGGRGPVATGANVTGPGAVTFAYGLSRAPVSAWTARFRASAPTQVVYFANVARSPDRGAVDIDLRVR